MSYSIKVLEERLNDLGKEYTRIVKACSDKVRKWDYPYPVLEALESRMKEIEQDIETLKNI